METAGLPDQVGVLTRDGMLENAKAIVDATHLPVSADLQNMFGRTPRECAETVRLAEMELYRGDARLLNAELDRYLAVTKDDMKRVAARYLTAARRSVVEVKPGVSEKK